MRLFSKVRVRAVCAAHATGALCAALSGCAPCLPVASAREVPPSAETSIESLGRYFRAREPDRAQRARAIHDYVASHIRYDYAALDLPHVPADDADAEWVFENRRGVCSGFAELYTAIGHAAGLRVVTLVGRVAHHEGTERHAWNAVWLGGVDGGWHSVDVTWDRDRHGRVGTEYFMPGEATFARDHFSVEEDPSEIAQPADLDDELAGQFRNLPGVPPWTRAATGAALPLW